VKDFFRPHFFVNTPDINPPYLHSGERPWFLCRAALAATLSGLWGVYNGFELCEGRPVPGKEEYLNSEKYEIARWDYDRPGNIVPEITRLNRIRKENPALKSHHGVTFLPAHNDNVLFYAKQAPGGRNTVLVAVNLAPHWTQEADVELPLNLVGLDDHASVAVEDLMRGHRFGWNGKWQRIRLEPALPFAIWRITAA
jgi:starch synthase (maltosyl-transferring)